MFLGQFYHTLDEKGRLTVPSRFRDQLSVEGAYVMRGFDQNLMVLPSSTFETWGLRIQQMNMMDPNARMLRRLLYSSADRADIDRAGRILLPQFLRQAAVLESNVVVIGNGDFFEIWSPDSWAAQNTLLEDNEANIARFANLILTSDVSTYPVANLNRP